MKDELTVLEVASETLEAFVLCLALGTLREMREGTVPYEVGIWPLGRPVFSRSPEIEAILPAEVLQILQTADEVDAMAHRDEPGSADAWLDRAIATLQGRLRCLDEPSWYARWAGTRAQPTPG